MMESSHLRKPGLNTLREAGGEEGLPDTRNRNRLCLHLPAGKPEKLDIEESHIARKGKGVDKKREYKSCCKDSFCE